MKLVAFPGMRHFLLALLALGLQGCAQQYGFDESQVRGEAALNLPRADALAKGAWPQAASDLAADAKVRFGALPNGLRYAISSRQPSDERVSLRMLVDVGWLMEKPRERGFAHLVEHSVFQGSRRFEPGAMFSSLAQAGVAPGARLNAHTYPTATSYEIDLPNAERELTDTALAVLRDIADGARLDPRAIGLERAVLKAEARDADTASWRVSRRGLRVALGNLALSEADNRATDETAGAVDVGAVRAFYKRHYVPASSTLIVTGMADIAAAERLLARHFGDWQAPATGAGAFSTQPLPATEASIVVQAEPSLESKLQVIYSRPWANRLDSTSWRRRDLHVDMAFSLLAGRLSAFGGKDDDGLGDVRRGRSRLPLRGDLWELEVPAKDGQWEAAASGVGEAVRGAFLYGFNADEVNVEVARIRKRIESDTDARARAPARAQADRLLAAARQRRVLLAPTAERNLYDELLDEVTPAAVTAAFRAYLKGAKRSAVAYGAMTSASAVPRIEQALHSSWAGWPGPRDITVRNAGTPPPFEPTALGRAGAVVAREQLPLDTRLGLVATRVRFDNGVVANLLPTQLSDNEVQVAARFGTGYAGLPRELAGAQRVLVREVTRGGIKAHDARALGHIFRDRYIDASLRFGADSLLLDNTTATRDLADQLALLAAYLEHSTYEAAELDSWRAWLEARERRADASVEGTLRRRVSKWVRADDYRIGTPPGAKVAALDATRLNAWFAEQRNTGPLEVSIVGDFDLEAALGQLAATLGSIAARKPADREALLSAKPLRAVAPGSQKDFRHGGLPERAALRLYWEIPPAPEPATIAALQVAARAIGLRLHEELREQRGLTYSPSSWLDYTDVTARSNLLVIEVHCPVAQIENVEQVTMSVLRELAQTALPGGMFEAARAPAVAANDERRFRDTAWAWAVLAGSVDRPARLSRFASLDAELRHLDARQVRAAVSRYLPAARVIRARVLPRAG